MPPKDKLEVISPHQRNKSLQNVRSNGNLISQSELSKAEEDDYLNQVSYDTETESFKWRDLIWRNVVIFTVLHLLFIYGGYRMIVDPHFKWQTLVATYLFATFSLIGNN